MRFELLYLVLMFTPAANLVVNEFSCQSDEFNSQRTNSFANGMKSIAKRTNSIAKTCIMPFLRSLKYRRYPYSCNNLYLYDNIVGYFCMAGYTIG